MLMLDVLLYLAQSSLAIQAFPNPNTEFLRLIQFGFAIEVPMVASRTAITL